MAKLIANYEKKVQSTTQWLISWHFLPVDKWASLESSFYLVLAPGYWWRVSRRGSEYIVTASLHQHCSSTETLPVCNVFKLTSGGPAASCSHNNSQARNYVFRSGLTRDKIRFPASLSLHYDDITMWWAHNPVTAVSLPSKQTYTGASHQLICNSNQWLYAFRKC